VAEEQVPFLLQEQGLAEQDLIVKPRLKRKGEGCCHLEKQVFLKQDHNIIAEYQNLILFMLLTEY
jgi:hypothetical protein